MRSVHSIRRRTVIALAASVLFVSACGGSSSKSSDTILVSNDKITNDGTYPASVTDSAGTVTVDAQPQRIVSLSPTASEMLYAIGAGAQVAALDSLSTYPAETASKVTKLSAFQPSVESILSYKPDLVLLSNDMNKITSQLKSVNSLKINVWTGAAAASLDDVYSQITQLGAITGHVDAAAKVVAKMQSDIASAVKGVVAPAGAKYYYELDNTFYSVTSNTFVGALLKQFNIANIADGVDKGNDYPQLNGESILAANPSIVFLADTKCCQQDAAAVAARPGWSSIDAVKNNHVVALDDDIASRWGPRVVDLITSLANAVKALNG